AFAGWTGNCNGSATTCIFAMDADKAVAAIFTGGSAHQVAVSVTGSGGVTSSPSGINCNASSSPCTANFPTGIAVTLAEYPGSGATFDGWGGDCTGSGPTCLLIIDGDKAVTAAFAAGPSFMLSVAVNGRGTVTSSPAGIDCTSAGGSGCFANFTSGTAV